MQEANLSLNGGLEAVRDGIVRLMQTAPLHSLPQRDRETAELVLAEVLNNIVEHAYGGGGGPVDLHLRREGGALFCHVRDKGSPLSAATLPAGIPPEPEALAEGGYGWFLIRSLAQDLNYIRQCEGNTLSFRLASGGYH